MQTRRVTEYPGPYFPGLPVLYNQKSSRVLGVDDDAEYLAALSAARTPEATANA